MFRFPPTAADKGTSIEFTWCGRRLILNPPTPAPSPPLIRGERAGVRLIRVHQSRLFGAQGGSFSQAESPHSRTLSPIDKGGEGWGEGGFHTARRQKVPL